jgi:hypothetical protein
MSESQEVGAADVTQLARITFRPSAPEPEAVGMYYGLI